MYKGAIIGYGGMGSWHAANIKEKISGIQVVGAYDIRPEAMEKAKADGYAAYDSLEALLADPQIDLVTIATPNDVHKRLAIAALRGNKHVVCEKPVALNAEELEEIIADARETGKLFSVHQNRRWDKDFRIVKAAKEQGLLGEIYFVESKVQGSRKAMHGWRGHKQNGGGMLLDWGVHLLDQIMDMNRTPVTSVQAQLLSVFTPEVDDNIKLLVNFADGCCATLEMATNCFINAPRWHVQGTAATLVIDDWSAKGRIVCLTEDAEMAWDEEIIYTEAGPTRTMAPRPAYSLKEVPLPQVTTDWSDYYNNIVDVLDGKAELTVQPAQALRVMRVIDLLFRSAKEGRGIQCNI